MLQSVWLDGQELKRNIIKGRFQEELLDGPLRMDPEYENIVFRVNANPKGLPAMSSLVLANVTKYIKCFH